jgi:hypothetical protein
MARLALPAIRKAAQARLITLLEDQRIGVRAGLQSDVETDLSQRSEGETSREAAYPYVSVVVEAGEIESGTRGTPTRSEPTLRVVVWGRRGLEGEYARLVDIGEQIAGSLDGWSHSETGLRWSVARQREVEEYAQQDGGAGLDGIGAEWAVTVKYCG